MHGERKQADVKGVVQCVEGFAEPALARWRDQWA